MSPRSRGTASDARLKVTSSDIQWADVIIVMEHKHKQRMRAEYPAETKYKKFHVLDIPDEYRYMDQDLVEQLQECVPPLIGVES